MRCEESTRLVMATPARWSAEGEVLDMRVEDSASSLSSSLARRASWVRAKEGMSRGLRGGIFGVLGVCRERSCEGCWL